MLYILLTPINYRDKQFFMRTVFTTKLVCWRYRKNTRCPLTLVAILKKSLSALLNAT